MSPRFSLLVPADGDTVALARTLASARAQVAGEWELLCAGPSAEERAVLREDERAWAIEAEGNVADRLRTALHAAAGTHVLVLDPGDRLRPTALQAVTVAMAAAQGPHADVVVTDESQPGGEGGDDFHKPTWSPEYLRGHCWTGRATVFARDLVEAVGGFDPTLDGAHEWDLVLRVTERTGRVARARSVECDRRAAPSSGLGDRPGAGGAARRAVAQHLRRTGVQAEVEETGTAGCLRVRRAVTADPLVSIVMPTAGVARHVRGESVELVTQALTSVVRHSGQVRWELVCVVDEGAPEDLVGRITDVVGEDRVTFVRTSGPFNFATAVNRGAHVARGDHLLLLNDDVEVLSEGWMGRMVEAAADPGVGATGAVLLFEDGRVQHAGVFGDSAGLPYHAHLFEQPVGYRGSLRVPSEQLAVTGACLLVKRDAFVEVGGMNEAFPLNFNDVDLCLKLALRGYRNLLIPDVRLLHFESSTRTALLTSEEVGLLRRRWSSVLHLDPYFHRDRLQGFGDVLPGDVL